MAAVPSIGRASRVVGAPAPEADATRTLYEQYANQIFRYCLHQLGSREEAEDAVQSTFLNAFRGLKRGVVPELESAWLFKIAHNVCLSRRRSSWRRGRIESPQDFDVVEELAPAPTRRGDELIGLQDVLEGMPENQRRAILLREWQGLSYREIAEELELSQAAVETLIFRARRTLAQGLEQAPADQKSWRARLRGAFDLGGAAAALQGWLAGGAAAVKVTAAVVAVTAATTVAASEPTMHHVFAHQAATPVASHAHATRSSAVASPPGDGPTVAATEAHAAVHPLVATPAPRHRARPHGTRTAHRPAAPKPAPTQVSPPASTPAPPTPSPAPQPAAPDPQPTPAAAPSTPPGQAKKADPPAAAQQTPAPGATADPPGQAKKDGTTATPPAQGHDNPGQGKKDQPAPQPTPAPTPVDAPVAPLPAGKDVPPGQAKKDVVQPVAPAPVAPDPVTTTTTATTVTTTPPAAAVPSAPDGNGNGNGHGQGRHP